MKLFYTLLFSLLLPFIIQAQAPTVQDCAGAIPICQDLYHEANSYIGSGNYPDEIDTNFSCTDGEIHDVWYTFTAQTSGNFSFIITPNNTSGQGDDYDWTVFNLTNATCADIDDNPSLEVSCNSWGDAYGFNGATGASTANGGTGNYNGPGTLNGPPWNADIPVTAGNIYVMMVSNWSESTYGYSIDFSSSSAQLFDNVPPLIHQILTNIGCGATSITFEFSENILCSTIAACDISLTGPGGPYSISSLTGSNCASGGTQEKVFTINFSPSISEGGSYSLNLNASSCSSVTDLCGNVAPSGSLPFTVNLFTTSVATVPASCTAADGSATVTVTGGSGNYTYTWNTTPPQNMATASNLAAGSYIVTISDGNCTITDTANVGTNSNLFVSISDIVDETCGMADGSATVSATGSSPFTYQWNTSPQQNTATASNLPAGNYTVTVYDANGCSASLNATIIAGSAPAPQIDVVNSHCDQADGSATVTVTGGSGNYTYIWSNGETTATISNLVPGVYSVTVDDGYCDSTVTVDIINQHGPQAGFWYHPNPISISYADVTFVSSSNGAASFEWNFGDNSGTFYGESIEHTYGAVGVYQVMLIVTDSYGCTDTLIQEVEVHDIFTIYIPNSFTPDGDGLNDVFNASGISWEPGTYEMIIYNRWGNIVFQTKDPTQGWNGGYDNNPDRSLMIPSVYVYQVKIKGYNYREMVYTGHVSLLK
ncbi:MAG: gliding motility-associated C-terminal domain-containing protein [Bacteroidota bacterium]